jgi:hypothetical protein
LSTAEKASYADLDDAIRVRLYPTIATELHKRYIA